MSYKTAAYVYLVALTTTLLFTTSKAEFDIEDGKYLVRKLLNKFIGIVLESESKNLDGLINSANDVVGGQMLQVYLSEVAKDTNTYKGLITQIRKYEDTFQELLENIKVGNPEESRIPMYGKLNSILKICYVTLRTCGSTESSPLVRSTSLISYLEESVDENKKDGLGFKISKGIFEVRKMIDILLQLAMDIICKDLKTLQEFGDELLDHTTPFWRLLIDAAFKSTDTQGHIDEYNAAFKQILEDPEGTGLNIPMAAKLDALSAHLNVLSDHSKKDSGASSSG